jgi:hypothetical protein
MCVTPRAYGSRMETTTRPLPAPVPAPVALPLPFDDEVDAAIPFVLTAAAHREVFGREVPPLVAAPSLVATAAAEAAEVDATADTRRLQARALLRSGMPITTIAAALGVDSTSVEAWTVDLEDELARRRSRRRVSGSDSVRRPSPASRDAEAPGPDRERLLAGLAFALAEVDADGFTVRHDRLEPVAVLLDAVRAQRDVPHSRLRIAVRLAPDLPADRVRTEVAERLGVAGAQILTGRTGPDVHRGFEIRVDVRDAASAELVRAWRDGTRPGIAPDAASTGAVDRDAMGLRGWDSNPQTFRLTADCSAS